MNIQLPGDSRSDTMKTRALLLWVGCLVVGVRAFAGECRLTIAFDGEQVQVSHGTSAAEEYQVVVSSDLSEWKEAVAWTPGDGLKRVHVLNPPAGVPFFVRVVVAPLSSDLAATPAEMTSALVGTTRWGYKFTSATKFKWSWETGNWSYAKTALDQGVIVLTYDADGNRPEVYREEVVLTFTGKLKGTFRYSEYTHGVEDSGSVSEGTFDLSPIPP